MGYGVRAAGLATTSAASGAPAACSQNADLAAIRVTSELARSEDPFVRCAGCGVGKGRRAPVHARASRNQLSSEKHIWFGRLFFVFLPNGAQRLIFTMNYHLRDDQVFTILTPNWPNSTSGPRGASGIQLGHNLTQSGSNLTPIGTQLGPIYIHKLPINRPSGRYISNSINQRNAHLWLIKVSPLPRGAPGRLGPVY